MLTMSKLDKEEYLKHLSNLRLAHKVELKNEKMLVINIIEYLVRDRLKAYSEAVNTELQNIYAHVAHLNMVIAAQKAEELEINFIQKRFDKTIITSKSVEKVSEQKENARKLSTCFYELQDLIVDHLRYIRGPITTSNKEIQAEDLALNQQVFELDLQNKELELKIDQLTEEKQDLNKNIEAQLKEKDNYIAKITNKYKAEVTQLLKDKNKLIQELRQVKMIFKSPYLYGKYRNAKFELFDKLEICKFKPKAKRKRKQYKSLSFDSRSKLTNDNDLNGFRTMKPIHSLNDITINRRLRSRNSDGNNPFTPIQKEELNDEGCLNVNISSNEMCYPDCKKFTSRKQILLDRIVPSRLK